MIEFIALAIALLLLATSVIIHYRAMTWTRAALSGSELNRRTGTLAGMAAMITAQMISVALYAVAYWFLEDMVPLGSLRGELEGYFSDQFYFSLMSYTTLGVGDVFPVGGFRVISGIEALNGFALIGWTASFAYTLMRQGWD